MFNQSNNVFFLLNNKLYDAINNKHNTFEKFAKNRHDNVEIDKKI